MNSCRFNDAVNCSGREDCRSCGWNPKVSEIRRGKLQNVGTVFEKGKNPGRFVRGEERRKLDKIIKKEASDLWLKNCWRSSRS